MKLPSLKVSLKFVFNVGSSLSWAMIWYRRGHHSAIGESIFYGAGLFCLYQWIDKERIINTYKNRNDNGLGR
jgi:hypothetical protein